VIVQALELWAGIECTKNRIDDRFVDQCAKSGHNNRPQDLELFKDLGVNLIRYPFLWETTQREIGAAYDWTWADKRMARLRSNHLTPIVTLLHHGSGPVGTSLISREFPDQFAEYARAFAKRFPWLENYSIINEPLTTARFSCLYGHWYPHLRDDSAFVRATLNQIKAVVLGMAEIRKVNPNARLIQTEDLGRAQSTEPLKDQCEFENERRFLSFDLLLGRVTSQHPLYGYLLGSGATAEQLKWFETNFRPPDILGINHYLLSNRFLDHRLDLYPRALHGGNGRQHYADVGAVDAPNVRVPSIASVLMDVWQRYHIPIAVTEVHIRGHRESQMRWLHEVWQAARELRRQDVDIRAVTAWSLLGSFDWHTLCQKCEGFYESGIFDLRSSNGLPRPTIMCEMVKGLSSRGSYDHPLLEQEGWWQKKSRGNTRPLLITGGSGTLANAVARICDMRGISYVLVNRQKMDIAHENVVRTVVKELKPWAIVNAAGYVNVDLAQTEKEKCFRENVLGAATLALVTADLKIPYVTFSTDLVFDGDQLTPYSETDSARPINIYGLSKHVSEKVVREINPSALIIRTSSFFGPWDSFNFVTKSLRRIGENQKVYAPNDVIVSPTYVPDLVNAALNLLIDREVGLIHLVNAGGISWAEFAKSAARLANVNVNLIVESSISELNLAAPRPRNTTLRSERVNILPDIDDALRRYFIECDPFKSFDVKTA
jgi:dTDP-4-dehydrorhamnose reductase